MSNDTNAKLDRILGALEQHGDRFDKIDQRFDKVEGQLDTLAAKVFEHDTRLDSIEQKTDSWGRKLLTAIEKTTALVEGVETEQAAQGAAIDRHDKDIHQIKEKVGLS